MRRPRAIVILAALLSWIPAGAQDRDLSTLKSWGETLRYGTDPEIVAVVGSIRDAKERSLLDELTKLLAASHSDDVRTAILSYLEELQEPAGGKVALELLARRDELSPALIRSILSYAAAIHLAEAYPDLTALAQSTDEPVAVAAVTALGRISAPLTAPFLLELYDKEGTSPNLKTQIILALGDVHDPAAVELLIRIAGDRGGERVPRMYASASLGKIGDLRAVPVLTANLSENDALIRTYAAAALGRLRAPGVAEILTQVLRDSNPQVRAEAARAIADGAAEGQPVTELRPMLEYRARRDETPLVRREAIRALGSLGGPESFDLIRELYEDTRQTLEIRLACLAELIKGDLPASLASIERVVSQEWNAAPDRQRTLEATAAELAKTESPVLEPLFGRFLESKNIAVRISGIRGAARNHMGALGDAIVTAARDSAVVVRREALSALQKLGIPAPQAPEAPPSR